MSYGLPQLADWARGGDPGHDHDPDPGQHATTNHATTTIALALAQVSAGQHSAPGLVLEAALTDLEQQRERGFGLREGLGPTYSGVQIGATLAYERASYVLWDRERSPSELFELARRLHWQAMGAIRFVLYLALGTRTDDGLSLISWASGRCKIAPGEGREENGPSELADCYRPATRPNRELVRHRSQKWLAHKLDSTLLRALADDAWRKRVAAAGGPCVDGRMAYGIWFGRLPSGETAVYAPEVPAIREAGGLHADRTGVWACFGVHGTSRRDVRAYEMTENADIPAGSVRAQRPPPAGYLGWDCVGPESLKWPA